MIKDIIGSMTSMIKESNVKLNIETEKCNNFKVPEQVLNTALSNILSNAIKYKSESRDLEIHIWSEMIDDKVCISIEDNGIGIDLEKEQGALFGMFKRIEHNVSGTGVGLYMVKKLLEKNGGNIEVESTLGKGSVFRILIKQNNL